VNRDKFYIENLLRNYKRNKSRLQILDKNLISDDDFLLGAIDYSKEKIQTSNLSNLDNIIEKREKEKDQLIKDITLTEILLDSLTERDYIIINSFYIERKTLVRIAQLLNRDDTKTVWRNKERILNELTELLHSDI
jgi:DNA-directed RNA polymerase specialized sigma subunit